jgi:hypothetical protein
MTFALALLVTLAGCGCFALAMEPHWRQIFGARSQPRSLPLALRAAGYALLLISLLLCLRADHPTMAVLVFVMLLAVCAAAVAMLLALKR